MTIDGNNVLLTSDAAIGTMERGIIGAKEGMVWRMELSSGSIMTLR